MTEQRVPDYGIIDQPEILSVLFHPRPDYGHTPTGPPAHEVMIPVEESIAVGACFHAANSSAPNILFFHGNGEIVADYADLGPLYNKMGVNFLAVDYRGYGRSEGKPTVKAMMQDGHVILNWTSDWLEENGFSGPLAVMGRSLGSARPWNWRAVIPKPKRFDHRKWIRLCRTALAAFGHFTGGSGIQGRNGLWQYR